MYKEILSFSSNNLETYLNKISFPKLTKEKSKTLDGQITEKELLIVLQSMEYNKSPGNDGLTKEFYITFWNEVKASCETTQSITKKAPINLIEKK